MARPWDWKAVRTVEAGRSKALSFVRQRKDASKTQGDWKTEYENTMKALAGVSVPEQIVMDRNYIPRSVVGANPLEAMEIRQNEIVYHVVQTRPTAEAFTDDSGEIDWAGYRTATEEWKKGLSIMAMSIPAVGRVISAAKAEGRGSQIAQFVLNLKESDLDKYYRRNDDVYEAVQRAYREGLYEDTLQAFAELKEAGDEEAWMKTVGAVGPIQARQLNSYIKKFYGEKFSSAELDAVGSLKFPAAEEIRRYNMNSAQAAKDRARTAFWDFYRTFTPPGSDAYEMRNIPLISVALDQSSRSLLTEDQYNMATAMAMRWIKERYGEDAMANATLVEEWKEARALREELDGALTEKYGPQALRLLAAYDGSGTAAAKKELRAQYPTLDAMLLARRRFGLKFSVYAKYYRTAMKPFGGSRGGRASRQARWSRG